MSETPDHPLESARTAPLAPTPPPPPPHRPSRLHQVAAWVGIVAGVVFIVAVVFGTGFMVGKNAGHRDHGPVMFHRGGPPPFPMGPRGEFERPPGFLFPGGPRSEPQPPPQPGSPTTTAPARP
ncbi:MAG: hypothetical protein ACRDU5_15110 [Mycobacterium sp.]